MFNLEKESESKLARRCHRVMCRAGCQKPTMELSLRNSQLLSQLRYPTDTRQLTSPQGEADGVSDRGMTLQALGGVNLPYGWYRVRGQLPSTGGREHTHTHTQLAALGSYKRVAAGSKPAHKLRNTGPQFRYRLLDSSRTRVLGSIPQSDHAFHSHVGGV